LIKKRYCLLMNREQTSEIEYLKLEVLKSFGTRVPVDSFSDFKGLCADIEEKTHEHVSDSTLKRIWGYVALRPKPRTSTLNILSQYAGRKNFNELCEEVLDSSTFFSSRTVTYKEFADGAIVNVGWHPDRRVCFEHVSGATFRVIDGGTSKLRKGDTMQITEFVVGQPLYISRIVRDGTRLQSYMAGKKMGILYVEED